MTRSARNIKKPPFAIKAESGATLTEQLVAGLRQAVETGFYSDGDFIPGYVELAGMLGVSTAVTRRAVAKLVREGLLQPRSGIGIRVCGGRAEAGNVLMVTAGDSGAYRYYISRLAERLRHRLMERHVTLSKASVPNFGGRPDYSELRAALNQHVSLVVIVDYASYVEKLVVASGAPFIQVGPAPKSPLAAGYVTDDSSASVRALLRHCGATGARRILGVGMGKVGYHTLPTGFFREIGCEERQLVIRPPQGELITEGLVRSAVDAFTEASAGGRLSFGGFEPDLVVFHDDYIAQGALLAMTAAGIRIPDDVQVVTLANKGLGPVWLKPLTRFEVDSAAEADVIADLAFDCMAGKRKAARDRTTSTTFIIGETTRTLQHNGK